MDEFDVSVSILLDEVSQFLADCAEIDSAMDRARFVEPDEDPEP